ncbi:MFS transporter [Butyrivibrio sp. XPD2006]|uniref:MFS transporter n=1 Tax=Butyrivibrio sp. XPD2006 TaxID=1280668 RepID=UPI0003B3D972|nr:MFS transporter [Butyrivibrio sp. XPD2006]
MNNNGKAEKFDFLWIILFLIIFINGFEAGGYQASLRSIGQNYDLSETSKGLFAATELFATMLAPLLLGAWADANVKTKCIRILLIIQLLASIGILLLNIQSAFVIGVFFLGLTTSALQFITIAALADTYPISGSKKIGFMTSMYALGALIAPLVVEYYLNKGLSWKVLFGILAVGSLISFAGIMASGNEKREFVAVEGSMNESIKKGTEFVLIGILLLCVIMCIYVGFENGFAYFIETLFADVLDSVLGRYALSVFWAMMIPSRVFVGYFAKRARIILMTALIAIPIITVILSLMDNSLIVFILCIPLGFASGAIYPCVLNMMLPFSGKNSALATGMITTATGIGGVVFTALTGFNAEHLGMRMAIGILAALYIFSIASAIIAGKMHKQNAQ